MIRELFWVVNGSFCIYGKGCVDNGVYIEMSLGNDVYCHQYVHICGSHGSTSYRFRVSES